MPQQKLFSFRNSIIITHFVVYSVLTTYLTYFKEWLLTLFGVKYVNEILDKQNKTKYSTGHYAK